MKITMLCKTTLTFSCSSFKPDVSPRTKTIPNRKTSRCSTRCYMQPVISVTQVPKTQYQSSSSHHHHFQWKSWKNFETFTLVPSQVCLLLLLVWVCSFDQPHTKDPGISPHFVKCWKVQVTSGSRWWEVGRAL